MNIPTVYCPNAGNVSPIHLDSLNNLRNCVIHIFPYRTVYSSKLEKFPDRVKNRFCARVSVQGAYCQESIFFRVSCAPVVKLLGFRFCLSSCRSPSRYRSLASLRTLRIYMVLIAALPSLLRTNSFFVQRNRVKGIESTTAQGGEFAR